MQQQSALVAKLMALQAWPLQGQLLVVPRQLLVLVCPVRPKQQWVGSRQTQQHLAQLPLALQLVVVLLPQLALVA